MEESTNHPTYNLFYSERNVSNIVNRIARKTNSPGLTSEYLAPVMRRVIDRFPGLYQVHFFKTKEDFTDQVIRHVQMLDDVVVDEISKEMDAHNGFFSYYYKLITGNRPLVDRPMHSNSEHQSRKSDSILLRDYTQWETFSSSP